MKYIKTVFLSFLSLLIYQNAQAELVAPYFSDLRSEITNQLTIASNSVPPNKKVISKLKASLKTLDRTKTSSLADGTKTLSLLVPSLNRSGLSNVFDADLQLVLDIYTTNYIAVHADLVQQLNATFAGKQRDSAQKALDKLFTAIQAANTNFDSAAAAKALTVASRNFKSAEKAVLNAKNAKLPPAEVVATITVSGSKAVQFKSKMSVAPAFFGGNFVLYSVSTTGTGLKTQVQNLTVSLPNLVPGANNIALSAGGGNQFTTATLSGGNKSLIGTGGSAQVVWNQGAKVISGTFSFNAQEQGTLNPATVTGSFTIQHL